jgi:hypothetical protein
MLNREGCVMNISWPRLKYCPGISVDVVNITIVCFCYNFRIVSASLSSIISGTGAALLSENNLVSTGLVSCFKCILEDMLCVGDQYWQRFCPSQ